MCPLCSSWFSLLSLGVFSDQLKLVHDRIYKTLPGAVSCFRLTNATHQIGCSGNVGVGGDVRHTHTHTGHTHPNKCMYMYTKCTFTHTGSASNTRGVLHYNSTLEGLNELIANGPHAPYIVLLEPQQFTRSNSHL